MLYLNSSERVDSIIDEKDLPRLAGYRLLELRDSFLEEVNTVSYVPQTGNNGDYLVNTYFNFLKGVVGDNDENKSYVIRLKEYVEAGGLNSDEGCVIECMLTDKVNTIFKHIANKPNYYIDSFSGDIGEMIDSIGKVAEIKKVIELFLRFIYMQYQLYTKLNLEESYKLPKDCPISKLLGTEGSIEVYPVYNTVVYTLVRDYSIRMELNKVTDADNLIVGKENLLFNFFQTLFETEKSLFSHSRELICYARSSEDIDRFIRYDVYKTLADEFKIVKNSIHC